MVTFLKSLAKRPALLYPTAFETCSIVVSVVDRSVFACSKRRCLMYALTKEKTILMIAHRLKTVRNADQILVVDKGRIVEQGKYDELMKQDGIYRRFVNAREIASSWKLGA